MTERVAITVPVAPRKTKIAGQIVSILQPERVAAYAVIGEPPEDIPAHYRAAGADLTAAIRARIAKAA